MLPICLAEIERTRPYFIGLLGQRYGWVPDEIPAALATELGWLSDDAGRSVTELEILHGVLNDPSAAGHAYFYLRDPAWVDTLAAEERATFVEESDEGQPAARRTAGAHPGQPVPVPRLRRPDRARRSGARRPHRAGRVALPRPDAARPADAGGSIQRSYGASRFTAFVERPSYAASLDEFAGRSGARRCWSPARRASARRRSSRTGPTRWAADHPDDVVVVHHVEADSDAADHRVDGPPARRRAGRHAPTLERLASDTTEDAAALRSMLRQAFSRIDPPDGPRDRRRRPARRRRRRTRPALAPGRDPAERPPRDDRERAAPASPVRAPPVVAARTAAARRRRAARAGDPASSPATPRASTPSTSTRWPVRPSTGQPALPARRARRAPPARRPLHDRRGDRRPVRLGDDRRPAREGVRPLRDRLRT